MEKDYTSQLNSKHSKIESLELNIKRESVQINELCTKLELKQDYLCKREQEHSTIVENYSRKLKSSENEMRLILKQMEQQRVAAAQLARTFLK